MSSQPQFLLISPKKGEQGEEQGDLLQNVSRRRMAFRPQSLKKIIASHNQKSEGGGEGTSSATMDTEKQTNKLHQSSLTNEQDKSRRIVWTFPEQAVLYEALKMHGKDFDAIAKFLQKRKINKDREQIRNYFLNTFKLWKAKIQFDDLEWAGLPKDARELFLLINAWEWRKKLEYTLWTPVDKQKFKTLMMDGIVTFRPKRKKFMITLKTPYCPALLKYFPYDKRGADIPSYLKCKLKPMRWSDRNYVSNLCEQNPYLQLIVSVNEKISTIFNLLDKKWSMSRAMMSEENTSNIKNRIKLMLEDGQDVHKIMIGIEEDNSPLLSLKRLKKDLESKRTEKSSETGELLDLSAKIDDGTCNNSKKPGITSAAKDIFEIGEEKIRQGLTYENVGNASMLQLFFLLGMNSELVFNYEIAEEAGHHLKPWEVFVSLVSRDYDELMAKSMMNPAGELRPQIMRMDQTNKELMSQNQPFPQEPVEPNEPRAVANQQRNKNIVEEENQQFIQQIKAQSASLPRRPKRQIKLLHDDHKMNVQTSRMSHPTNFLTHNNHCLDGSHKKGADSQRIIPGQIPLVASTSRTVVDFSSAAVLMSPNKTDIPRLTSHFAIDAHNEFSLDSTTIPFSPYQATILDNSPSKSLPEDVRNAMSEMLKESSVDYCRKFEKLTRMHQEGCN